MRRRLSLLAVGVALAAAVVAALPSAALAVNRVTLAARVCPSYAAITANLARNDIQETLEDLGAPSLYRTGEPISPEKEALGQPTCRPITGWRFAFGRGARTRAVRGTWGSLAQVTNPFARSITTLASTPVLDATGADTGRALAGATTVDLSAAELALASRRVLWVQGGLPADPVLAAQFPGGYAFGALRCSVDNLNGDNVEYVAYPTGASHVFCFAYYVQPPPASGVIVVRKELDAPAGTAAQSFAFTGDVTFNASDTFTLAAAPASQTFYRSATSDPWTFREIARPGYPLTRLSCDSANGASTSTTDLGTGAAQVVLGANDTVTCTFRNTYVPPPAGLLTLGKVTLNAPGTARFDVAPAAGGAPQTATVTTTEPQTPVYTTLLPLAPGDYTVTETPADRAGGEWVRREVACDGQVLAPFTDPLRVTLTSGAGRVCEWTNEFVPDGSITVRKVTLGGTGAVSFAVRPVADPATVYQQAAFVGSEGVAVTAAGDDTGRLALGSYDIEEAAPTPGNWQLESVVCNGVPVGSAQGRARIELTAAAPSADCTFTNRAVPASTPAPSGGILGGTESNPAANLRLGKRVRETGVERGGLVHYTLTVRNARSLRARDVVVTDVAPKGLERVAVDAPRGVRCRGARTLRCTIGTLRGRRAVTLHVTYRATRRGRLVNRAAVATSTAETRLGDNRDVAAVRVGRPSACTSRVSC